MKPSRPTQPWAAAVNKGQTGLCLMELIVEKWETDNEQVNERHYLKIRKIKAGAGMRHTVCLREAGQIRHL